MVKIYENEKDVAREHVANRLHEAKRNQQTAFDSILSGTMISLLGGASHDRDLLIAQKHKTHVPRWQSGLNKVLMWAGGIIAVVSAINWFQKRGEVNKLEADARTLGPEEVKYPESFKSEGTPDMTIGKYRERLQQEADLPTTRQL